ncbi:Flavin-dependent oxidoreductase, luciferase family (includes alkanesulfonate monooxygenase SsuD and methylene tetrahydromethanopterin reductase) [Parafrankia irregularis]|uniref:Flavin-dependent oxidoreductase, luciferase family (Includes alkanesulfonate monooxygenase SsuD and methylene tetrahydromethanopterin reductase) n=1 Tax=Parafrankia irregularis TaxID=795642 RepID=A0A0S4QUX2_9ACTN|nr:MULTISPECIES: LLM class flavin-dependent oxidoreductase [Parafrankia]MBE3201537.1 LLM class flavin-dependent oxidoreductase [Parafrankia sp. CH37]CUU59393.1 Flavin-dependent oxidoreductase, luciferase family (includes alkanesulfonate monooxygenase SsuD and methylene tetrahydromethanopterin reductase) [Parafrankia irregularis]
MFTLRFDMRAPETGAPATELYAAALEMASWAESRGCLSALLCEHHMASDGYLPAPLTLASAMAARTSTLTIMIAIVILPLHDPVQLAEELAVLDIISKGRVMHVMAIGYRPAEYEMYGVDYHRRGRIADEKIEVLLRAKTGEAFEYQGRRIQVTPAPVTPGGPMVSWGGGSIAAARRAGRNGIGFFAQKGDPELRVAYEEAARAAGHEPGMCVLTPDDATTTMFVAEDVDAAWEELGPYLMHDVRSYAAWNEGNTGTASLSFVETAEELRRENRSHRILSVPEAIEHVRAGAPLGLHPLIGGLPPEIAWRYLKVVDEQVMPALAR